MLENYSSTTFIDQLSIAKRVYNENPHLYYEIQSLNPYNKKLYKNIKFCLEDLIYMINKKDERGFVRLFGDVIPAKAGE